MKHAIAHWILENRSTARQMLSKFRSKDLAVANWDIRTLHREGYIRSVARHSGDRNTWIGTKKLEMIVSDF